MNTYDFIAIEGVIGAGKTSLSRLLSQRHNARLVLEEFEDNPFLPKFYEDRARLCVSDPARLSGQPLPSAEKHDLARAFSVISPDIRLSF